MPDTGSEIVSQAPLPEDLFDILDISLREDSYTRLIKVALDRDGHARRGLFARLAKNTSPDVDAVEVRFRQPFPRFKQPFPINRAASSDRPDLLLRGMRDGRDVCWIVLEAKIASGEGLQQPRRYRCQCARAKRKKQIRAYDLYYVTPVPRTASDRTFHNLTHGSLVAMIDKCPSDPAPARNEHFDVAWAALHDRLKHLASIQPNDTDTVLPWLEREERFATRDVRCTLLVRHIAPTGYLSYGGYLDTHGRASTCSYSLGSSGRPGGASKKRESTVSRSV